MTPGSGAIACPANRVPTRPTFGWSAQGVTTVTDFLADPASILPLTLTFKLQDLAREVIGDP